MATPAMATATFTATAITITIVTNIKGKKEKKNEEKEHPNECMKRKSKRACNGEVFTTKHFQRQSP